MCCALGSFPHWQLCFPPQAVPAVAPLVGGQAPDFEAQAVYDQEFVTVKLSDYKVG